MDENKDLSVGQPLNYALNNSAAPNDSSSEPELAALWQTLYAQGKVKSPHAPETQDTPWYIAVMQAFAAWIAALFLLGFMASLLNVVFDQNEEDIALVVGIVYLGIGLGFYLLAKPQIFVQQFAFAVCLSGLLGIAWGLYNIFGYDFSLAWYLCMASILLLLWGLINHSLAQFVFAFCVSACFVGIAAQINLFYLCPSVLVLIVSSLLFNLNRLGRHYQRARMLLYGFALMLLDVQLTHAFSMDYLFDELFNPLQQTLWFSVLQLLIIFVIGSFLLINIYRERQQSLYSLSALSCFIGLVLVSGLSLPMQGLSTAILLILLGHYSNEFWLKSMGIISALLFVSGYYYSLETTLLLKSAYMMGLGALLLVARVLMWRLFPANENAKETM
ncbi:DUF4401 domain-containing protein [Shewanella morhuae]|uniref:Uncharacterized membrane-anchored protein n=1 Tax=Shewanella morhuae TaxID=365591 RepID=A0A379ZQC6_9GAMM|nr:DUF4401 domain-containing protein [Shewanella morhuae]SUI65665.1 Uncharacterized membrane-anchored protein [Shewanella morhuae]